VKAIRIIAAVLIACALLLSAEALAADHGVFADGAYSPGSGTTKMDELVDKRVDDAKAEFDRRNTDADDTSTRVDNKQGLEDALNGIACECGDTITIVMVGHGKKNSFKFTKEGKSITPKELLELLESATIACCCKIHIVIFSCHSGSWIDDLFKDVHVQSVYTSCKGSETSRSDAGYEDGTWTDNGDWIDNFNKDWQNVPAGTSIADQMEKASETAESDLPPGGTHGQHPQGWRRGQQAAKGHVESVRKKSGQIYKMKIHFYEPEFMRCTQEWVELEPGADVPDDLEYCDWVSFQANFGDPNGRKGRRITVVGEGTETTAPQEDIIAHVEGRSGNKLKIHTVSPTWMYCIKRWLEVEPPGTIAGDIQTCKWISVDNVDVDDPDGGVSTGGDVTVDDDLTFRTKLHIEGSKNHAEGTSGSHILAPPFLRCRHPTVKLPPGALDDLENCDNVWVDYEPNENTEGQHDVTNVKKIIAQGSRTHYYEYDACIDSVIEPQFSMTVKDTVNPEVVVRNVSQEGGDLATFNVVCSVTEEGGIDPVYEDTQPIEELPAGEAVNITFQGWTAAVIGNYTVCFALDFPSLPDDNLLNNSVCMTTTVTSLETWPIPGDSNFDGKVDILDMIFVRNRLYEEVESGDNWRADHTGDGSINVLDMILVRNRLYTIAETTPPLTNEYVYDQETILDLPPEVGGGQQITNVHGYVTWHFEPTEVEGIANMTIENLTGTGTPLLLYLGTPDDPVSTGEIVFDFYDVDYEASGGTVDMDTGAFTFTTVLMVRAPELEEMGFDPCPEPMTLVETGTIDFIDGTLNLTGTFNIDAGMLTGTVACFSKGGSKTTTKKLGSSKYRLDVRASYTLLWLRNLDIPDGKVKVKVTVIVDGKEVVIEEELEIEGGNSTQGLKVGGLGDLVKVKSVEITYEE